MPCFSRLRPESFEDESIVGELGARRYRSPESGRTAQAHVCQEAYTSGGYPARWFPDAYADHGPKVLVMATITPACRLRTGFPGGPPLGRHLDPAWAELQIRKPQKEKPPLWFTPGTSTALPDLRQLRLRGPSRCPRPQRIMLLMPIEAHSSARSTGHT